ncbi:hypothetical protein Taro_018332 [Colocasia esculenta]|uniref:Uncharacterized protein n=1 Tax=Colocasia esculenta TaxID=4460 RepID=A0A843UR51_COLES|nr:hypothetical protein [Colocasia esculenta]
MDFRYDEELKASLRAVRIWIWILADLADLDGVLAKDCQFLEDCFFCYFLRWDDTTERQGYLPCPQLSSGLPKSPRVCLVACSQAGVPFWAMLAGLLVEVAEVAISVVPVLEVVLVSLPRALLWFSAFKNPPLWLRRSLLFIVGGEDGHGGKVCASPQRSTHLSKGFCAISALHICILALLFYVFFPFSLSIPGAPFPARLCAKQSREGEERSPSSPSLLAWRRRRQGDGTAEAVQQRGEQGRPAARQGRRPSAGRASKQQQRRAAAVQAAAIEASGGDDGALPPSFPAPVFFSCLPWESPVGATAEGCCGQPKLGQGQPKPKRLGRGEVSLSFSFLYLFGLCSFILFLPCGKPDKNRHNRAIQDKH